MCVAAITRLREQRTVAAAAVALAIHAVASINRPCASLCLQLQLLSCVQRCENRATALCRNEPVAFVRSCSLLERLCRHGVAVDVFLADIKR